MAKAANSTSSATGDKKKQVRGPQKRRFYFFVRIKDANGNPLPDAELEVVKTITDARQVIEFIDSPEAAGTKRIKYESVSTPRGEEGAASLDKGPLTA